MTARRSITKLLVDPRSLRSHRIALVPVARKRGIKAERGTGRHFQKGLAHCIAVRAGRNYEHRFSGCDLNIVSY
jgi:hypothetical protein